MRIYLKHQYEADGVYECIRMKTDSKIRGSRALIVR